MTTQSTLWDLRQIPLSDLDTLKSPKLKIHYNEDIAHWKDTVGYHDYQLFLCRLNESIIGYTVPPASNSDEDCSQVGEGAPLLPWPV